MKLAFTERRIALVLRPVSGQSMVEYLVGLAVVTAIVAVPIDGHPSLIEYFLAMVRIAYLRFFTAIAMPA